MSDDTAATQVNRFQPIFKGTGDEEYKPDQVLPLPAATDLAARRPAVKKNGGQLFKPDPKRSSLSMLRCIFVGHCWLLDALEPGKRL